MELTTKAKMEALEVQQWLRTEIRQIRRNPGSTAVPPSCEAGRAKNLLKSKSEVQLAKRCRFTGYVNKCHLMTVIRQRWMRSGSSSAKRGNRDPQTEDSYHHVAGWSLTPEDAYGG